MVKVGGLRRQRIPPSSMSTKLTEPGMTMNRLVDTKYLTNRAHFKSSYNVPFP